jgi:SAM-dependent methyltransferase
MSVAGHDAPLDYHRRMLDDPHRMDAYERALRSLVRPGDVVLDLGCGTGVLAMLAVRCGAARVHAVESMPVIEVARALAAANGMAGRIRFHHADAVGLAPVEPVDLVISDFLGVFLVDDNMIPAVRAAARWLRPGGRFAPSEVRLLVALAGDFTLAPIDSAVAPMYGVELAALRAAALGAACRVDIRDPLLLSAPEEYHRFRAPDGAAELDREVVLTATRAGRLRGVVGWFEATLAPGVVLSSGPGIETHWGQLLFPLAPLRIEAGARVRCRVRWADGDWRWTIDAGAATATAPLPVAFDRDQALDTNERGAAAYHAQRVDEAARLWEEATALLDPRDPDAPGIYENLGLAYHGLGRHNEAVRAFLRALDGAPTGREQSLRFLVQACLGAGRRGDAARYLALYEGAFGKHPAVSW